MTEETQAAEATLPEYTQEGNNWIVLLPGLGFIGESNILTHHWNEAYPFLSREAAEEAVKQVEAAEHG